MSGSLRPQCVDALRRVSESAPSAVLGDGDGDAIELRRARQHIDVCPACSSLIDDAGAPERVLHQLSARRPPQRSRLRVALGAVACVQAAVAIPWLVGANPLGFLAHHVASDHLTRDGAIGVIVGVAGLTTALRPRHAFAMLVMAVAAIGMQMASFAVDENHDHVPPLFEVSHALVPVILALIVGCALRREVPVAPPDRGARLRVVR